MIAIFAQADAPPADVASFLESVLPHKYAAPVTTIVLGLMVIGRVITGLKNDPGVISLFKSVFGGSSTTTQAVPNKGTPAVAASPAVAAVPAVPPATKV